MQAARFLHHPRPGMVLLLGLFLASPAPHAARAAADESVRIQDNRFLPREVTIIVGESVTWTHEGRNPHSVTADDGSFDSSPLCPPLGPACLQNGQTYSRRFTRPGTVTYHCKIHGTGMSGVVNVLPQSPVPSPSPSPEPSPSPSPSPEPPPSPSPSPELSPSPSPELSPSPSPELSPSPSPTLPESPTPGAAPPQPGGGASGPVVVAIVAAFVAVASAGGLVWLRRAGKI